MILLLMGLPLMEVLLYLDLSLGNRIRSSKRMINEAVLDLSCFRIFCSVLMMKTVAFETSNDC